MNDWQSWAAPAVVVVTLAIFAVKKFAKKPAGSCGSNCGCDASKKRPLS